MTSCRFSKIVAPTSQIYFRFSVWWRLAFKNTRHCMPRFDKIIISIQCQDIIISGFCKRNGRHIENLLPISTLTFSSLSACDSVSAYYQISPESDHPWQSYDVIAIFKMSAVSHVGFALGVMIDHPRSVVDGCCLFYFVL